VKMRQLAKSRGEKINEYGVDVEETGETIQFKTEEQFFEHFNLPFIGPELRENGTEVEKIIETTDILERKNIRGELHMHTTWSDGAESVEEMVDRKSTRLNSSHVSI